MKANEWLQGCQASLIRFIASLRKQHRNDRDPVTDLREGMWEILCCLELELDLNTQDSPDSAQRKKE